MRLPALVGLVAFGTAMTASPAWAQVSKVAIDSVIAVEGAAGPSAAGGMGVNFDSVASIAIAPRFVAIVRPRLTRSIDGHWSSQVCQLAVRFESAGGLPIRFEFGQLASPVGLGTVAARASDNPTIALHQYYYEPIPTIEVGAPVVHLISAVYPLGGQVSMSRDRWDARVAVLDSSPVRPRKVFARINPPRMAQLTVGGGVTPVPALRFGASISHGAYRRAQELPTPSSDDRTATTVVFEGQYARGHTQITGEWVRDWIETSGASADPRGWFVEGTQVLSPRWYLAGRAIGVRTAEGQIDGRLRPVSLSSIETVVGYRLAPELTVRLGHLAVRPYGNAQRNHRVGASLVWGHRWF